MRVKDAAAEYLAKAEGQFCSGEVLAAHLGVRQRCVESRACIAGGGLSH